MKKLFIVILFFISSCSPILINDFDFKSGIKVQTNGFHIDSAMIQEIFDLTQEAVVHQFEGYTQENTDAILNDYDITVIFLNKVVSSHIGGESKEYWGLCQPDLWKKTFTLVAKYESENYSCRTYEILMHEILHMFLVAIEFRWGHPEEWFIGKQKQTDSIEGTLRKIIRENYCSAPVVKLCREDTALNPCY